MYCTVCGAEQREGAKPGRGKAPSILGVVGAVIVMAVIAVVLAITLGGCAGSGSVVGTYYNIVGGELLVLKADGTFTGDEMEGAKGTYRVDGNEIYLTISYLGYVGELAGTIEGKNLNFGGVLYLRK